ncbi:MAG TPA: hypothetical protein VEW26_15905 [Allosphingosinicella sp.]|nr:hypothetical protein [Allosphingosinicella sp.]
MPLPAPRLRRIRLTAALSAFLLAQPAAADEPRKVAISPGSPKGARLFKVPPAPANHVLLFTRVGASPTNAHWVLVKARPIAGGDRFIVTALPPGRYRLDSVHMQRWWLGCLHAAVPTFTIEPGKIAYLGSLDTRPTLASISRSAQAHKNLTASLGQWYRYRIEAGIPRLADRDPQGLVQAESFVRREMPRSAGPVALAELGPGEDSGPTQSALAARCNYAG